MVKKKDTAMPGYSLGYPMYHAMTGNLPVISKELHKSSEVGSEPAPLGEDLQPGWAELVDPISGSKFWWNTFYRSRREDRPTPMDDGRRGAGRGDVDPAAKAAARRARLQVRLATKTWQEKYDFTNSRPYYWNRKRNTVQWARPPSFHEDGLAYKPVWSEKVDLAGEPVYVNTKTGETTAAMPDDFDALPVTYTWEFRPDGLWHNYVSGERERTKPAGAAAFLASTPADPPPPPPEDMDLEDFADEDEFEDELQDDKVYPMIRGALKKRGGAYSLVFGSTAWKERYFVSEAGVLTYYSAEEAVHSKKGAKKGWKINLRYYGVNSMPSDPRRFALVPTPDAFTAYTHAAGVGMPPPDRVFEFEAPNEHIKRNWTEALRGKAVEVEKDEGGVHDDTNEEVEAQRAAMKAAAHRTAGRGVYRIASKAAIQKGGAADKVKKAMEEDAAASGLGVAMRGGGKKRLVTVEE